MNTYLVTVHWNWLCRGAAIRELRQFCNKYNLALTVIEYKYLFYSEYRFSIKGEEAYLSLICGWTAYFTRIYSFSKASGLNETK